MSETTIHDSNNTPDAGFPPAPPEAHQRAGAEEKLIGTATYSPEDNKLRLYPFARLNAETYACVKAAGFGWAPKQGLFVAGMWTPRRADLLVELCGEIGDEDTSLVDRAEERADRFENYRDKRTADAQTAHRAVAAIADNIPFGQPILVGHHSERHARRDAERIANGMRKAIQMWDTAQYWKSRAAGAIHHAKYKELPAVRARRIKTIEADKRKALRNIEQCERSNTLWQKLDAPNKSGEPADAELIMKRALFITGHRDHVSQCFPLSEYPRELPASQYEGSTSLWSALDNGIIQPQQARELATAAHARSIAWENRWIAHYDNRLAYEVAMLEAQGAAELIAPKKRQASKRLPLCNYRAPEGITCENKYRPGTTIHYPQVDMTQAQYTGICADYKGSRVVEHSHRIRTAMVRSSLVCVFLTDSKVHQRPEAIAPPARDLPVPRLAPYEQKAQQRSQFDALREQLKAGVQIAVAPQLFPTPLALVQRMVELAQIARGERVLEPSAGTGRIVGAARIAGGVTTAVEINSNLVDRLKLRFDDVRRADFLQCNDLGQFDVIVMNPPFGNAQDIEHIMHAVGMLKEGGRLVAICANGPRQNSQLRPFVEERGGTWEVLPADTFKESGTNVHSVLLSIAV